MALAQLGGVKERKRVLRSLLKADMMTLDCQSGSDSLGSIRLEGDPSTRGPMIDAVLLSLKATLEKVAVLAQIVKQARNPRFAGSFKSSRELARASADILQMSFEGLRFA